MVFFSPASLKFKIEQSSEGEVSTIPAVLSIFTILALVLSLALCTSISFRMMETLIYSVKSSLDYELLAVALVLMIGCIPIITCIAWLIAGKQSLRFVGTDLEVRLSLFGIHWRKVYSSQGIRSIGVAPFMVWSIERGPAKPFGVLFEAAGSVQFEYGKQMRYVGQHLNRTEAAQIVAWLKERLPNA